MHNFTPAQRGAFDAMRQALHQLPVDACQRGQVIGDIIAQFAMQTADPGKTVTVIAQYASELVESAQQGKGRWANG